jgi:hypothetical protein
MDDTSMRGWLRPAATLLASAAIVIVLINAALLMRNQKAQVAVNQRQQVINLSVQYSRAGQLLVQTIARIAVTAKDDSLVSLLERHGIKINVGPPAADSLQKPEAKP